jgi:hypothetical protein
MMQRLCKFVFLVAVFFLGKLAAGPQQSGVQPANVPNMIQYFGVLKSSTGEPLSGTLGITFALYKEQESGAPLWVETQNVVADEQGRFGVLLGAATNGGVPVELFASGDSRWLELRPNVSGSAEQPRTLLVSVPYALKAADADTLGGKPLSAFVLAPNNSDARAADSDKVSGGSASKITTLACGTAGRIAKFINSTEVCDSIMFENNGRIGVDTTTPISKFNVVTQGASDYITLSAYQADLFDKGFLVRTARGTSTAPAAVNPGNILFNLYAQGHDGTDYGVAGGITMAVDGPVSTGVVPGNILFQTASGAGAFAERMRINSAGNVGIGSQNPGEKLHIGDGNFLLQSTVERSVKIKRDVTFTKNAVVRAKNPIFEMGRIIQAGDGDPEFRFLFSDDNTTEQAVFEFDRKGIVASVKPEGPGSHFEGFVLPNCPQTCEPIFRLNSSPKMRLEMGPGQSTVPDVAIQREAADTLTFLNGVTAGNPTGVERLRIDSGGNVGIGTNGPTAKLDVVGNFKASGVAIGGGTNITNSNNIVQSGAGALTVSLPLATSIPAASCITQTVSAPGVTTSMAVIISPSGNPNTTGLAKVIWRAFVDAPDQIIAEFCKFGSGTAISTASQSFNIRVIK